jgi:transposase
MQQPSTEDILSALKHNPNAAAVARQLGIRHGRVHKLACRAFIELTAGQASKGRSAYSPEERARLLTLYHADPNPTRVAKQLTQEFGRPVSLTSVLYLLRKQGLVDPPKPRVKKPASPDELNTRWVEEALEPIRERTPAEFREEQRRILEAQEGKNRPPLPPGQDCWEAITQRTSSLAGARYPLPVARP